MTLLHLTSRIYSAGLVCFWGDSPQCRRVDPGCSRQRGSTWATALESLGRVQERSIECDLVNLAPRLGMAVVNGLLRHLLIRPKEIGTFR
jgi:hypothetical protein